MNFVCQTDQVRRRLSAWRSLLDRGPIASINIQVRRGVRSMRAAYESPPRAHVDPIHIGDSNLMCDQAWRRPTRCLEIAHQTRQGVAAQVLDSNDGQQPPRATPMPAACVAHATTVHPISRRRGLDRRLKARFQNQEDPQADAWSSTTAADPRRGAPNQNQNCSTPLLQARTTRGLNADQA